MFYDILVSVACPNPEQAVLFALDFQVDLCQARTHPLLLFS